VTDRRGGGQLALNHHLGVGNTAASRRLPGTLHQPGSKSGGCCNRGTNQNEAQHRPLVGPGDRVGASRVHVVQWHPKAPDDKADCGTREKRQQRQICQAKLATFTGLAPFGVLTHGGKIPGV